MTQTPIGAAIPTGIINDLKKDLGVPAAEPSAPTNNGWVDVMHASWGLALLPLTSWAAWMAGAAKAWEPSRSPTPSLRLERPSGFPNV
jgi:hypothetical protein